MQANGEEPPLRPEEPRFLNVEVSAVHRSSRRWASHATKALSSPSGGACRQQCWANPSTNLCRCPKPCHSCEGVTMRGLPAVCVGPGGVEFGEAGKERPQISATWPGRKPSQPPSKSTCWRFRLSTTKSPCFLCSAICRP